MRHLPELEIWFDFSSNYSYPAVMRIENLAAPRGVLVRWRPFLLGPVFKAMGWASSPLLAYAAKERYVWRDMERRCTKHGLLFNKPSVFPRRALLPMRIATLGVEESWIGDFCRRVMLETFVHDREIDDEATMYRLLAEMSLPASAILVSAQSEENKLQLRLRTEEAVDRGVFGAPTLFVRQEMFWGDDRLEDAVDWAML